MSVKCMILAVTVFATGCSADEQGEIWNPLTVGWQRANCPVRKDLRPFAAGKDGLIEATVLQLGADRLYVPTAWVRTSPQVPWYSPAPRGVHAIMGGSGHSLDEMGKVESGALNFPGDLAHESCLGFVHRQTAGEPRVPRIDPDFSLELRFRFASTDSATGAPTDHGATVYGYQVVRFTFMERGDPDPLWDGAPALVFPLRPGAPVLQMVDGRAMTFRSTPDGTFVSWHVTPQVAASFEATRQVPPQHVAVLSRKALFLRAWLKTPPARRGNEGVLTF